VIDPTTDGDALGYLLLQASLSHPNGREEALIEKCAEYLRSVVREHAQYKTALLEIYNDGHGISGVDVNWVAGEVLGRNEVKA
jgi:hypothetical protein